MKRKENKHLGSNFDEFLREEGMLGDATAAAIKRMRAYQVQQEVKQRKRSKKVAARKTKTSGV